MKREIVIASIRRLCRQIRRSLNFLFNPGAVRDTGIVSVIIPLYNDELYIEACLRSVQKQNYRNFECIIVDDASTDCSNKIAERICSKDSRFSLVKHTKNQGLPSARNTGIEAAKGEYLTFLDSDDYLYQDSLLDRVLTLAIDPTDESIAGSFCHIRSVPQNGEGIREHFYRYYQRPGEKVTFLTRNGECPFPVHAPLIYRRVFQQVGLFDPLLVGGCEDWDLWQRILRRGFCFLPTGTIGGAYRVRANSMRMSKPYSHLVQSNALLRAANSDVKKTVELFDGGADTPFFYERMLSYYTIELAAIRRTIRAATFAAFNEDVEEYQNCRAMLPPNSWNWVRNNLSLQKEVSESLSMAIGLRKLKDQAIESRIASLQFRLVDELSNAMKK